QVADAVLGGVGVVGDAVGDLALALAQLDQQLLAEAGAVARAGIAVHEAPFDAGVGLLTVLDHTESRVTVDALDHGHGGFSRQGLGPLHVPMRESKGSGAVYTRAGKQKREPRHGAGAGGAA